MAIFNFLGTGMPVNEDNDYEFKSDELADDVIGFSSQLGTPIVSNLVFKKGSYTIKGLTTNYEGIELNTVLIVVNQSKNIVTTSVQGRSGTVKEYISDGDYVIKISGYLVNDDNDSFPTAQLRILNELLKAPKSLEFYSEFLTKIGSFDLTVTDYSFPQEAGFRNRQAFEINALSDNPIELQLNAEA